MSVHYDHDIYWVPACKKVPEPQYIVRPHAPRGAPGVYAQFRDFYKACEAARNWRPEHGVVDQRAKGLQ